MATAIIGGLKTTGFDVDNIIVFEPSTFTANKIKDTYGVHIAATNTDALRFKVQYTSIKSHRLKKK